MSDLILYSNPMSRARITRWMLEEVGEPYEVEFLGYDSVKSPDYLAINPMGKVPALRHGDTIVTEGAAICAYLAAAFPEAGLMPAPGTPASADYYRWMFFAAGPVEAAVTAKAFGWTASPERERAIGFGNFETTIDVLEQAVAGKAFIAGDRFSAADVYAGSQIGYGLTFKTIPSRPAFEDYWAAISARPALKRATEADDTALRQQGRG